MIASAHHLTLRLLRRRWFPAASVLALLAAVALLAYRGSWHAPFVFDDLSAVRDNASIRRLWPLSVPLALAPQAGGAGSDGRPLVNLSLAFNYALGGLGARGYRLFNLGAHVLAGFCLWQLVRRTLLRLPPAYLVPHATAAATAIALLWVVHPLQTETVLVAQNRSEIMTFLATLLVLLTLIRSAESCHPRRWAVLAIAACYAGAASKETMASAPLLALFYDRAFLAGSFRAAWQLRRGLYLGLASSWLFLGVLVIAQQGRSGTAGFGLGVSGWDYLVTQSHAIFIYLKLTVWPHPLVFDYGLPIVRRWTAVWPEFCGVSLLLAASFLSLRFWPRAGFLAFAFFALLAPSSSIVPIVTQTMAEHRMYAPLAAFLAVALLGIGRFTGRRTWFLIAPLALAGTILTTQRAQIYQDEITLWRDTLARRPENPTAWNNLGSALLERPGALAECIACLENAIRLRPNFAEAHYNLGTALLRTPDRLPDAVHELEQAVALQPDAALAYHNLGNALVRTPGRRADAIAAFEHAIRLHPDFPEAYRDLGVALAATSDGVPRAIECYTTALRLRPDFAAAHNSLANALLQNPAHLRAAIDHYQTALRLQSDNADVHSNLGVALAMAGRLPEAIAQHRSAIHLRPDYLPSYYNLALALLQEPGHRNEAIACLETTLKLDPTFSLAREKLDELKRN